MLKNTKGYALYRVWTYQKVFKCQVKKSVSILSVKTWKTWHRESCVSKIKSLTKYRNWIGFVFQFQKVASPFWKHTLYFKVQRCMLVGQAGSIIVPITVKLLDENMLIRIFCLRHRMLWCEIRPAVGKTTPEIPRVLTEETCPTPGKPRFGLHCYCFNWNMKSTLLSSLEY